MIGGPTASGKSALALEHAIAKNGVVINADSMQLYDALPTLTAQPGTDDLAAAPHRLYACLPPDRTCSAAQWQALANAEIDAARASGKAPIVVGGTGFYLDALLNGLSPMPDVPAAIREQATQRQAALGNPGFHAELARRDPVMAKKLHPNDTQRLIRAWEVLEASGRSLAHWQAQPRQAPPAGWRFRVTILLPERARLYQHCNDRFIQMINSGVLDEVEQLAARIENGAVAHDAAITHALGFRPLRQYLAGRLDRDSAIDQAQAETRQYAKRQTTWFRHQIKSAPAIESITFLE